MEKQDEAIVLQTRPYSESDQIVTLFLREAGKRNAIAKGAKRSQKRFGPLLEIGSYLSLIYRESSRGDLLFLQEVSSLQRHLRWREAWQTIAVASYALEISSKLLPEGETNPSKFNLLKDFLSSLHLENARDSLLQFEFSSLSLAGWHPDLDQCGICSKRWEKTAERNVQPILDHYWEHILSKPLLSRKLLDEIVL